MDDKHRHRLTRATSSLREWLDPLAFTDLHRSDVTALLTEHVVAWALLLTVFRKTQMREDRAGRTSPPSAGPMHR